MVKPMIILLFIIEDLEKSQNWDGVAKSRNSIEFVIPAKAGIQLFQDVLDPGFRRGDDPRDFYEAIIHSYNHIEQDPV